MPSLRKYCGLRLWSRGSQYPYLGFTTLDQLRSLYIKVVEYILGLLIYMTGAACHIFISGDLWILMLRSDCGTDRIGIRILMSDYDRPSFSLF